MKLTEKVGKTIRKYGLLTKGDRVLVAYSGGLDSTALLFILRELGVQWSLDLVLAHFNHKLRRNAEEDEFFAKQISEKYSLLLYLGSEDVRTFARRKSLSLEEAGRELRYRFLEKTARKCGATRIATGHTMTDQAETFLMRLLRGSGPRGLGGIFPVVEGKIIRPLIEVERGELECYLEEKALSYRVDESNFDRRFLRNRIRLELIPYIREKFEPRIVPHLSQLASILREEEKLLEVISEEEAEKAFQRKNDDIHLDMKVLSSLPRALRRRVVRSFILRLKGDLRGVSFSEVESLLELKEGKEIHVGRDLVLRREAGILFQKKEARESVTFEYFWDGISPLEIKELGLKFRGKKLRKTTPLPTDFNDQRQAFLVLDKLTFPLTVRSRREGDRYQPLGAPGKKKLKEIMRAKGIPLSEREKKPVFLSKDEIVWVLGLPVSERFKVGESTQEVFLIKIS